VLRQRVLTALVLLPAAIAALFLLPPLAWGCVSGIVIVIGAFEWGALAGFDTRWRGLLAGGLVAAMLVLLPWSDTAEAQLLRDVTTRALCVAAVVFWLVVALPWMLRGRRETRRGVLLVAAWLALLPAWVAALRLQPAPWQLLALMATVWIADSAAYFAGRAFGRHKLAPAISPGKTWEGVAGAVVAVVAYAIALRTASDVAWVATWSIVALALALVAVCAISIVGDLFESWLKRVAGVKDSGRLLPGHGGVLDRIDALAPALPLSALLFAWPQVGVTA
jgi:phosphatidate cytidylyltransferase